MTRREFHPDGVTSILIVRLYFVGDVLLATPVLEALKRRFPGASVSVLLKKRAREVLVGNPFVDEIIEYDGVPRYHSPVWLGRLATQLRRRRFDLAVDLTGDLRSSWVLLAAEPGYRVGVNHAGFGFLLDRRVRYRAEGHVVDHLLTAVEVVGAALQDPRPRLFLDSGDRAAAVGLLSEVGLGPDDAFVALSPGANRSHRRWPADRFGRLARLVVEQLGLPAVVTGSARDVDLAREVVRSSGAAAVSLAGRTSLRELGAVAARARAFVGNDSGPLHVAASQGTPVVALFGASAPEQFAPRGAPSRVLWHRYPCSPCRQRACRRRLGSCMEAIAVDEVLDALASLLAETAPTEVTG